MPARLVLAERTVYGPGEVADVRIRMVEPSARYPEGIKVACVYVRDDGAGATRRYGVDNAHREGPHEHTRQGIRLLPPMGADDLRRFFYARVADLRGGGR
jgi:hypothetical protein